MKWFEGSIAEAITKSKLKKAVFVVFVEGPDEVSKNFALTINTPEISSRLESEQFVAIKLQSDSENYTFFVKIYHLVPVPSIFFIGENGTPLEIIGNPLSASELAAKIDSVILKTGSQSPPALQRNEHSSSSKQSQDTKSPQSSSGSSMQSSSSGPSSRNEAPIQSAKGEKQDSVATTSELTHEEKVKRAKELIELQNRKKMEEEERKMKEKEIERRTIGKNVQKSKQEQKDKEIKDAFQECMKEKAAIAAAREKILKQIAEDKLERKKRYEQVLMEQEKSAQVKKEGPSPAYVNDATKARIQFKLPTGESVTNVFDNTSTIGTLRAYVTQNVQMPFQKFTMSSFFPRREFTAADDQKTLSELNLIPSAVIMILPIKSASPASVIKSVDNGGIFSHFFWTLLAPVFSIYNYVMGYFSGRPREDENTSNNENRSASSSPEGSSGPRVIRIVNYRSLNSRPGSGTTKVRSRGNIHTLHSGDNDSDENNTWNGNSTQQM